jgi:hypothetical protein
MTYAATALGLYYPEWHKRVGDIPNAGTDSTLDATGEIIAFIGRIYIDGRPGSAKTISAAGGGSISYRTAAVTFANAGTSVSVGIQDVASTASPGQPDGSFDVVSAALVGGGGLITANAWQTVTMTGGTGSKSITHGDLIAVVIDMTARAGADSVIVSSTVGTGAGGMTAYSNHFAAAAWSTGTEQTPTVLITFDDGTIATLDGGSIINTTTFNTGFAAASTPDERGEIFQVPWDCKIDAIWGYCGATDLDSDFSLKLYADPLGTPSALATIAVDPLTLSNNGASSTTFGRYPLAAEVELTRNTDYAVTMLATGTTNSVIALVTLANAAYRALWPGGTTLNSATRSDSSGAFSAVTTTHYLLGVRISSFHDTSSGGSSEHTSVWS